MKLLKARNELRRFAEDTSGSAAVEYTLIASAVCIVLVGIVEAMGQKVVDMLTSVLNIFS
jgi:Flp pilus assembly pilin Flp